jgi:hypothetical protein
VIAGHDTGGHMAPEILEQTDEEMRAEAEAALAKEQQYAEQRATDKAERARVAVQQAAERAAAYEELLAEAEAALIAEQQAAQP